jgi:phosphoglycolate phosphatase
LKRRIEAVLFDLDGTLVDTLEGLAASVNFAMEQVARPRRTREEIRGFIGEGVTQLVRDALGPDHQGLLKDSLGFFTSHYLKHCAAGSALYPGAKEALARLDTRVLAMVTNKPEAPTMLLMKALGLSERFKAYVCGDTLPVKKPDPAMVREACWRLGVAPENALMVGDAPGDVASAHGAGALACAVSFGYRPAADLKAAGADFVVDRLTDIPGLLGG